MSAEFGSRNPQYWRRRRQLLRMEGEICPKEECKELIFPPRDVCPGCGELTKDQEGQVIHTIEYNPISPITKSHQEPNEQSSD